MRYSIVSILLFFGVSACAPTNPDFQADASEPEAYHQAVKQLTDVIVHDIFSPPVASRIYAYATIAGYEALRPADPSYVSLASQLTNLGALPQPAADQTYCFPLAGVHAVLTVGKTLIFSEELLTSAAETLYEEFETINMPRDVYARSIAYGEAVAEHILAWANNDQYKETRTAPKYPLNDNPARWQPTPPAYMDGIEPSWNQIRPFVLESAQQFKPEPPTPYSTDTTSLFWQELLEVYTAMDAPDRDERLEIAQFWDCNPYVSHQQGHVMFATKKITPGGHWINIIGLASRKAQFNMLESANAYAMGAIAMADAFISCWDEKYRSELVRPETVINLHLDPDWMPPLQTPPFPEYTSGHSVVSRACAVVLTDLFGDHFAFDDTTEQEYGLTVRSFTSFLHASEEAAVSRLYGGIHYRPAIDNGLSQGEAVGSYVLEQLETRTQISQR